MKPLDPDYKPNSVKMSDLYDDVMQSLLDGVPSVKIERFPMLTKITGGLRPNEYTLICGSTGTGKTTLCANLSASFIDQSIPHFVASVETGAMDYATRVACCLSGNNWNQGERVPLPDLKEFNRNFKVTFNNAPFWLSKYEEKFPVETLMNDLEYMVKKNNVEVAIIDNFNFFMESVSAQNQVVEADRVTHELVLFVKRTPIHIIMICHPRKTQSGRVESEFDIKGSSSMSQECQNVLLFNRPAQDLIDRGVAQKNDRELTIAKMRRKGMYVGSKLILKSDNGTTYTEGVLLEVN